MNAELNRHDPYPGPRPFERRDEKLFFGRPREVRELRSLIIAHRVVLLYAQSGAGKTSLVNAGLIPLLEEKGFEVLPVASVRGFEPENIDLSKIPNIYVFNTLMGWIGDKAEPRSLISLSIADFLKEREHLTGKRGLPSLRFIIFDQFEELFTLISRYPEHGKEREEFFRQVAEALEKDPLLRVLFVIKEEYLASLDPYKELLPEQLRTHYRLERLGREAACLAVQEPLRDTGRSFKEGVASSLVQKLLDVAGEYVEPVQLQVVCSNLWDSLPPEVTEITSDHLQEFGDVDEALKSFYESSIKATEKETGVKEGDLRTWFCSKLITPAGTRRFVFQDQERTEGIPNEAVDELEKQHIIRAEMIKGEHYYELTHDRLVEPIKTSNKVWLQSVQVAKRRQRMLQGAALLVLLLAIILGGRMWHSIWKEDLQVKNIKELKQGDTNAEAVIDEAASHFWNKQVSRSLAKLIKTLQENENKIPPNYGVKEPVKYEVPFMDPKEKWPLTLIYHPEWKLDEGELHNQWRTMVTAIADKRGIPVSMFLKLDTYQNIPVEEMYILFSDIYGGRKEIVLLVPWRPGLFLVSEPFFPEFLRRFFNDHKGMWTELKELKTGGPWWMVPRWTLPLWKVSGHRWDSQEPAVAVVLANKLLNEPELILTPDCGEYLLKRVEEEAPRTVKEALSARGGIDGVRKDLIEIIRLDYPLIHLKYLLDALAKYPDLSPSKAAKLVVKEQKYLAEDFTIRLSGPRTSEAVDLKDYERTKSEFQRIYQEASRWLPPLEHRIRVYLGSNLLEPFITREGELKLEVIEALPELRGDIYKGFGFIGPAVMFYEAETGLADNELRMEEAMSEVVTGFLQAETGLADNELRIEILNQTENIEYAKPISVLPGQALERLEEELRFRYVAFRTWWLTAERVYWLMQDLPEDLRKWLEAQYSLTDIKRILRAVIAPNETELDVYVDGGQAEDAFRKIESEQTLRYPSWLLGSLVFWVNISDPLDCQQIASHLRETQRARLSPVQGELPSGKVAELVKQGIEDLDRGMITSAAKYFENSVELDQQAASHAFLAFYSQQSQFSLAGQLDRLEILCTLPEPGKFSTAIAPTIENRYELEDLLDHFGEQVSPKRRHKLQLYLLWSYVAEEHYNKAADLQEKLLSQHNTEEWGPEEEYSLAYLMLDAHAQHIKPPVYRGITPPEQQGEIKELLTSAFKQWTDRQASNAFDELTRVYTETRAPSWYWLMLNALADLHPQSYRISYWLGYYMSLGTSCEDAMRAIVLLNRAKDNLSEVNADEHEKRRAWHNYHRADAYLTIVRYGSKEEAQNSVEQALKLLTDLIKNEHLQTETEGWPNLDWVYSELSDAYIWQNKIELAEKTVDEGLRRFPTSDILLRYKFFMHLAKVETDSAVRLAQDILARPIGDESNALFMAALAQLLTGKGEFEYSARRFLGTNHTYRDYIRMMLYWSLCREGKVKKAEELLSERRMTIDPSTWPERMEQGDQNVWREKLICYYLGEVKSDEIFGSLQDRETFERSPLSRVGMPFYGLRCETYFYDALLQGVSGNPATRQNRQFDRLKKVLDTHFYSYYEYHMARYLIERLKKE